jgi:hypothetical protein
MKTRTIEIETQQITFTIEVDRTGTPVEAFARVAYLEDDPWNCLQAIRNSKVYMAKVAHEFEKIDWNDKGDEGFEDFKENVAKIIGLRKL